MARPAQILTTMLSETRGRKVRLRARDDVHRRRPGLGRHIQTDGLIPEALLADSYGDSRIAAGLIQVGAEDRAMASAVRLREDYSAAELRALARRSKNVNQSRRLLSLAAVRDGMDRGSAAKIGGMDRQTLRDWVHRFNGSGLEGLVDNWTEGPKPRLSAEQLAQLAQIVEAGPDREKDGVVRWRRLDLKRVIAERFGVDFHPRYVGKLLKKLGFSHVSARPRHPAQDERIVEAFKKTSRAR
jgi:transposase